MYFVYSIYYLISSHIFVSVLVSLHSPPSLFIHSFSNFLSLYLCVCLSIYPSIYLANLSICLSIDRPFHLSIFIQSLPISAFFYEPIVCQSILCQLIFCQLIILPTNPFVNQSSIIQSLAFLSIASQPSAQPILC